MTSPAPGSPVRGPGKAGGHWVWRASAPGIEIRFVGRRIDGAPVDQPRHEVLAAVDTERPVAWAKQFHSARVLEATAGRCGEGDALVGGRDGTALSVITADCVPILISAGPHLAAIHAGWRGLAAGVVQAAVDRLLPAAPDPSTWTAWIGPSIGACCYEVGEDVAARVAAATTDRAVITPGPGRPHLDLPVATIAQLARAGVGLVRPVLWCTRCETTRLHSYRREGQSTGRNVAFIWRT
jgi:hypothetical protein